MGQVIVIYPDWHMPWLLLIALQPLAIVLARKFFERNSLNNYAQKSLQPWVKLKQNSPHTNYSMLRNIGYWLAWILLAIAAAGPRIAEDISGTSDNNSKNIMFVLDISQSMQATDITPSRLRQASKKINLLVDKLPDTHIGIIVYAAKPHLYVPMTHDKNAIKFYLRNLEFLTPPSQGSRPSLALALANQTLSKARSLGDDSNKYIIHITDADTDKEENNILADTLLAPLKQQSPIYTLLMASIQGDAIPASKDGWLNIDGRPIISRPAVDTHKKFSRNAGGELIRVSKTNTDISKLINKIRDDTSSESLNNTEGDKSWNELFALTLIPGILLFLFSMSPFKLYLTTSTRPTQLLITLLLFSTLISTDVIASQSDTLPKAYNALIKGEYLQARELYVSMSDFTGSYGAAVASYKMKDYPRAIRLFEQAILFAKTDKEFADTLYNIGNSYFQIGSFKNAITSYQGALLYRPDNEASKNNLVYTKRVLISVEERKKNIASTTRAGRGPRSALAAEDIILNENNGVSLDNSETTSKTNNNPSKSELDIPEFIILKGLSFAEKSVKTRGISKRHSNGSLSTIVISGQLHKIYDNQPILWQRIFELEEGYPAPLSEPDSLPGVRPW